MEQPTSISGFTGNAHVGTETWASVMASWSIPEQFRAQAVQNVNLLVIAAAEGSYSAQAFIFDTQMDGILSTLLVAVSKLDSPSDPNTPIAISYVTINSNAVIKQQYTPYNAQQCHRCIKCGWTSSCCCHTVTEYSPRGNTPEEVSIIEQKMAADQYACFNRLSASSMVKRTISENQSSQSNVALREAIEKFLSSRIIKAEILASYNDSVLSALQLNIGSLRLSSQSLKLVKIAQENVLIVISTLAKDYDFEDITTNAQFLEQFQSGRFSYENFFTISSHNDQSHIGMKYIWIVGQRLDNTSYSMNFLSTLITPWKMSTTRIALNMLRYSAASTLLPRQNRMLSYFDSVTVSTPGDNRQANVPEGRTIAATILALSNAISGVRKLGQILPTNNSFTLGLTYSDELAWDQTDYFCSPSMNGNYRSVTLFKNGDSLTNTASFLIVVINTDLQ